MRQLLHVLCPDCGAKTYQPCWARNGKRRGSGPCLRRWDEAHEAWNSVPAVSLAVDPEARRFWAKVKRGLPDECWEWQGALHGKGYGLFSKRSATRSRAHRAHRIAIELSTGRPIPEGLVVMHRCDNPPCCNPDHLWVGTQHQNVRDSYERGNRNGKILCPVEWEYVWCAIFSEGRTVRSVARDLGVAEGSIRLNPGYRERSAPVRSHDNRLILGALREADRALGAEEIGEKVGLSAPVVARRCVALRRERRVRLAGRTYRSARGHLLHTYEVTG